MGLRFDTFKVRNQTKKALQESAAEIERVGRELAESRADLEKMRSDTSTNQLQLRLLEGIVRAMENNLAGLRQGYEKFVAESKEPSPAYPLGI